MTDQLPDKQPAQEILPPLPAPSAWQHAAREEPDEDDDNEVFKSDLPPDLQFEPVERQIRRKNGFTPERQRAFIAALAACGSVRLACKTIGCSNHAMHKLRHGAGAESFSAAWDNAVARGVRRILDVMVDNAVNGTPEYLYQNGQLVAERRRFNTRGMMWLVSHYMPDRFAVEGGLMHQPGNPAQLKRLKEQWREEWRREMEDEMDGKRAGSGRHSPYSGGRGDNARVATAEETYHSIMERMHVLKLNFDDDEAQKHVGDPEKQAAFDILNGPQDWDRLAAQKQAREIEDENNRQRRIGGSEAGGAGGSDG